MSLYRRFGKRALDLSISVPAFVALAPLAAAIGVGVVAASSAFTWLAQSMIRAASMIAETPR